MLKKAKKLNFLNLNIMPIRHVSSYTQNACFHKYIIGEQLWQKYHNVKQYFKVNFRKNQQGEGFGVNFPKNTEIFRESYKAF
jgi:hypothetical protein